MSVFLTSTTDLLDTLSPPCTTASIGTLERKRRHVPQKCPSQRAWRNKSRVNHNVNPTPWPHTNRDGTPTTRQLRGCKQFCAGEHRPHEIIRTVQRWRTEAQQKTADPAHNKEFVECPRPYPFETCGPRHANLQREHTSQREVTHCSHTKQYFPTFATITIFDALALRTTANWGALPLAWRPFKTQLLSQNSAINQFDNTSLIALGRPTSDDRAWILHTEPK